MDIPDYLLENANRRENLINFNTNLINNSLIRWSSITLEHIEQKFENLKKFKKPFTYVHIDF